MVMYMGARRLVRERTASRGAAQEREHMFSYVLLSNYYSVSHCTTEAVRSLRPSRTRLVGNYISTCRHVAHRRTPTVEACLWFCTQAMWPLKAYQQRTRDMQDHSHALLSHKLAGLSDEQQRSKDPPKPLTCHVSKP
jgi:hypothetical protein